MPKGPSPKRALRNQERKKRIAQRQFRSKVRRSLIFTGLATLGILIIVALIIPSIPGPERDPNISETDSLVQPGMRIEDLGRGHFPLGESAGLGYYNSNPPTSGMHSPNFERCGIFDASISKEIQVHNLEHGFMLIQYNEMNDGFIGDLTNMVEQLPGWPNYYILAPHSDMKHKIALSAWGVLQYLDEVEKLPLNEFAKAYRGKGPESGAPACQSSTMLE